MKSLIVLIAFLAAAALADLRSFDVSQAQAGFNPDFWKCAYNAGYRKPVIRAYRQACGTVRSLGITSASSSRTR